MSGRLTFVGLGPALRQWPSDFAMSAGRHGSACSVGAYGMSTTGSREDRCERVAAPAQHRRGGSPWMAGSHLWD
jgi:hypothetical protein